jgi:hypothetical protein
VRDVRDDKGHIIAAKQSAGPAGNPDGTELKNPGPDD